MKKHKLKCDGIEYEIISEWSGIMFYGSGSVEPLMQSTNAPSGYVALFTHDEHPDKKSDFIFGTFDGKRMVTNAEDGVLSDIHFYKNYRLVNVVKD